MQYNKTDTSSVDAVMLIDHNENQLPSPPSLQQDKVLQKKLIQKYRLSLLVLLILLLICLIILFATFLRKNQNHSIINSPVLLQLSTCNSMNGISNNNNEKINWLHINKEQLIAILRQLVCMVDPNCQSNNKSTTAMPPGSGSTVNHNTEDVVAVDSTLFEDTMISQTIENRTVFENSTVISFESLGHVKGLHWLSGSTDGVNLVATKSPASTFWLVYVHSNEPLIISLRCLISIDPEQRWLKRADDDKINLGESEMDKGAQWTVKCNTGQSSCLLSNVNGTQVIYLDGYTNIGKVGFTDKAHTYPHHYTGAYWRVVVR